MTKLIASHQRRSQLPRNMRWFEVVSQNRGVGIRAPGSRRMLKQWRKKQDQDRDRSQCGGVKDAHAKDLMRHSDIKTTMNVYGKTVSKEMRDGNARVVRQLL